MSINLCRVKLLGQTSFEVIEMYFFVKNESAYSNVYVMRHHHKQNLSSCFQRVAQICNGIKWNCSHSTKHKLWPSDFTVLSSCRFSVLCVTFAHIRTNRRTIFHEFNDNSSATSGPCPMITSSLWLAAHRLPPTRGADFGIVFATFCFGCSLAATACRTANNLYNPHITSHLVSMLPDTLYVPLTVFGVTFKRFCCFESTSLHNTLDASQLCAIKIHD